MMTRTINVRREPLQFPQSLNLSDLSQISVLAALACAQFIFIIYEILYSDLFSTLKVYLIFDDEFSLGDLFDTSIQFYLLIWF